MPPAKIKPRIHVLLARDARVGVVIRRGPSKQVCTIHWDRERDEFQVGQWFKGRIYERRSDISPDGSHLIYFAMNGKHEFEAKGAWTAISRAPYLKAIALFPKGDCWHGGGLFTGPGRYWLNDGRGHSVLRDSSEVRRDKTFQPVDPYGSECLGVYYPRLVRDGWTLVECESETRLKEHHVFEKPAMSGWTLRKIANAQVDSPIGKGCYWDQHELRHGPSGTHLSCPDWEWAEVDRDRLVWAAGGKILSANLGDEGPLDVSELLDCDGMNFEALAAPY